VIFPPQTL